MMMDHGAFDQIKGAGVREGMIRLWTCVYMIRQYIKPIPLEKKIIFYTTPSLFFSLTDLSLFFFTQEHSTIFQIPAGGRQARLRRHRAETPKHPKNQSF
jgi:hypothetical protein